MTTQTTRPKDCRDGNTIYGMGIGGRTAKAYCTCASRCDKRNMLIAQRNAAWRFKGKNPVLYVEREEVLQAYMAEHYD